VTDEHEGRVRQADAAARSLEERDAGLTLEHGELLGDRGRRVLQRLRHGGDRPALVKLVEQAEPVEIEQEAMLLNTD
jgi:hypothetical protein